MTSFVITGSTKGIGFALAKYCVSRGHDVMISGRAARDVDAAVASIHGTGSGKVAGCATDVTDPAQVQVLWDQAVKSFGRVDIWINNAGVANTTRRIVDI